MNVEDVTLVALRVMEPAQLLRFAFERFGDKAAIGTSLQKTGVVMIDMASRLGLDYRVFFIDTLVNPPETYEVLAEVEERYGIAIERFSPPQRDLDELHAMYGQSAHYFGRELCCRVRKQMPMSRALATLDVWVSGLRSDQSDHRRDSAETAALTADASSRKILKLNPLLEWTDAMVDDYTRANKLPYNKLYDYVSEFDERYTVIGCERCHVPVKPSLDKRMGKFPWEHGKKECGIHNEGGGI